MTLFKSVAQMPCLRRYFLFRESTIQKGEKIYLGVLESHTNRTKLDYFNILRYTRRPLTARIHSLFKKEASGLKRHPVH